MRGGSGGTDRTTDRPRATLSLCTSAAALPRRSARGKAGDPGCGVASCSGATLWLERRRAPAVRDTDAAPRTVLA